MPSEFDREEVSEINSLVVAKLDGLHIQIEHLCEKIDDMNDKTKDMESRLRLLEVQAAQMPLKIALLAAGTGMIGGGGIGALLKGLLGGG